MFNISLTFVYRDTPERMKYCVLTAMMSMNIVPQLTDHEAATSLSNKTFSFNFAKCIICNKQFL